jgi:hypothetical protein
MEFINNMLKIPVAIVPWYAITSMGIVVTARPAVTQVKLVSPLIRNLMQGKLPCYLFQYE